MQTPIESTFPAWKSINPHLELSGNEIDYKANTTEAARIFETRGFLQKLLETGPVVIRNTAEPSVIKPSNPLTLEDEFTEYFHSPPHQAIAFYYPEKAKSPRMRRTAYGSTDAIVSKTRDILLAPPSSMENPIRGSKPDDLSLEMWYEKCSQNPRQYSNPYLDIPPRLMSALEGNFGHVSYQPGTLAIFPNTVMLACDARGQNQTEAALLNTDGRG